MHDWSDEECVQILRRCREAVPEQKGKVIIAEAVIVEGEEDKYIYVRLALRDESRKLSKLGLKFKIYINIKIYSR